MILTKKEILQLVETEMNEGCHNDFIEDYETELDFYISNVDCDGYLNYISDLFPHLKANELEEVRCEVFNIIKDKF